MKPNKSVWDVNVATETIGYTIEAETEDEAQKIALDRHRERKQTPGIWVCYSEEAD